MTMKLQFMTLGVYFKVGGATLKRGLVGHRSQTTSISSTIQSCAGLLPALVLKQIARIPFSFSWVAN